MKKIGKFIKSNIKTVIAFTLGLVIAGGSAAVVSAIAGSSVEYTDTYGIGATTVQDAIDKLYQKASACPSSPVKLGDYISLTPTQTSYTIKTSLTGYTSDQTINPSELNLWRVIDIHSDGSFDVVSEYTSSIAVYFRETTGFTNFVGALNTIAAQYQKSGYTIGSRMMGYGGQTSIIGDTSAFDGTTTTAPSTTSTPTIFTGTGEEYNGGVLGDTLYLKDCLLVMNVYGSSYLIAYDASATTTARAYWLASRRYRYNTSTNFILSGRYVAASGTGFGESQMRLYSSGSWRVGSFSNRVRPILTLKSGLTVASGTGTKASPYVFN